MHVSDAVLISIVTTVPTFLTVVVTQGIALSRQRRHGEQLRNVVDSVNGNTQDLIDANKRLIEANRQLSARCPILNPSAAPPLPLADRPPDSP